MLKPASVFSRRTEAVVLIESAVKPASLICFESAIEKQPACAAARSSSGFVPFPSSKRVPNEYCAPSTTPLSVETVPLPSLRPPCHTAEPVRFILFSFFLFEFKRQQNSGGHAPPLFEQRAEPRDNLCVCGAVRGDEAVAVEHVGRVVAKRVAENVGHAPARFRQARLGRAGVPLLRLRREMDVEVCLLLNQEPDLDADRMAPHFRADTECGDDRLHPRPAMRTALRPTHPGQFTLIRPAQPL